MTNTRMSDRSIQSQLMLYFIPILILGVVLTGVFSYYSAVQQLKKNANLLLSDTIRQTVTFMNEKFYTVFEQLVIIEENPAFLRILSGERQTVELNRYDDILELRKQFEEVYRTYYQMIDSIYVSFNNGRSFDLQKDFIPKHVGISLPEWQERYHSSDKGYYWLGSHIDQVFDSVDPRSVVTAFKMIGTAQSEVNGIVLINLRESHFLDIMRNVDVSENGTLALVTPDSVLFAKELDPYYRVSEQDLAILRTHSGESGTIAMTSESGKPMVITYDTAPINGWIVAAVVPERDLIAQASQIKYISFYVTLLILLVTVLAVAYFARSLSNPIRYLSKEVRRFERGDFRADFHVDSRNEIGILSSGLMRLSASVQELLQQVRDEQEKKRQIELLVLQSQIQPHFLYNTLGSIRHLIDMDENLRARTMVNALTQYFRISISRGKEVITVSEELEHVRNYLLIQNIRYSREFDFEIDVDKGLMKLPVMKLTLQPIVENAIYHGIKSKRGKCQIRITGYLESGQAKLEVYDDGAGMSEERLYHLQQSIHSEEVDSAPITFGLRNVNLRLVLHFGAKYGLQLESEEGVYTRVTVTIPGVVPSGGDNDA